MRLEEQFLVVIDRTFRSLFLLTRGERRCRRVERQKEGVLSVVCCCLRAVRDAAYNVRDRCLVTRRTDVLVVVGWVPPSTRAVRLMLPSLLQ